MTDALKGSCFCGKVTFEVTGKPILSAYCHCTRCQRRSGMPCSAKGFHAANSTLFATISPASPVLHTIHFKASDCRWTNKQPINEICYNFETGYKCKECGTGIAWVDPGDRMWCIWGAQFERDQEGKIKNWDILKPTAHIYYDTRVLDVDDELGKWKGLEAQSERM